MIKDWVDTYKPANKDEATHASREIEQEVALAGLYRSGFFEKAAFYGGSALRIFYGLDRFSEDLDFSFLKVDPNFSLSNHLSSIQKEFESLGMLVSIREKVKTRQTNVKVRDWYDMGWYIKKGVALNLHHFLLRAKDSRDWDKESISEKEFRNLLNARIESVDFKRIKADIRRFIASQNHLDIWSLSYFKNLTSHLKITG